MFSNFNSSQATAHSAQRTAHSAQRTAHSAQRTAVDLPAVKVPDSLKILSRAICEASLFLTLFVLSTFR